MKNPNGYGSITKLTGNRRKPWMVRIFQHFKENGTPVHKVIGYFKSKTEANAALVLFRQNPTEFQNSQMTFKDVWRMMTKQKYIDLGKKVPNSYSAAFNWLKDIHDMPIQKVKLKELQQAVNDCTKNYSTKKNIRIVASLTFKYAIGNDIVSTNYAELVELPENAKSDLHKEFTEDEIKLLWKHSDNPSVQIVLISIYTGMRPKSLTTLENANVHLEEQYMVGGVKTSAAKMRDIPIADCILPFVKKLYNPNNIYLIGGSPVDNTKPMSYDTFAGRYFRPAMKLLNMHHLPHDGRGTCETQLDRLKIQRSVIDAILGHAQKSVGEKYYRTVTVKDRLEAVNQLPHWSKSEAL